MVYAEIKKKYAEKMKKIRKETIGHKVTSVGTQYNVRTSEEEQLRNIITKNTQILQNVKTHLAEVPVQERRALVEEMIKRAEEKNAALKDQHFNAPRGVMPVWDSKAAEEKSKVLTARKNALNELLGQMK